MDDLGADFLRLPVLDASDNGLADGAPARMEPLVGVVLVLRADGLSALSRTQTAGPQKVTQRLFIVLPSSSRASLRMISIVVSID